MTSNGLENQVIDSNIVEFLDQALAPGKYEAHPLAGDASMRRYYRIIHADSSYVLMSWDPFSDIENYPFLSVLKHFQKHNVSVPEVLNMAPDKGLILLEDLGDLTVERKFWESQDQSYVLPFYYKTVDELIKIHYAATDDRDESCSAFQVQFDRDKFLWELNYARKNLLEDVCRIDFSTAESDALDECFDSICTILDKEPKRISHRDYHSRNVMLKLGKVRVIDFQDARLGPVQYDLVSLIHDSYVDLNVESQEAILGDYLKKAESLGYKYDLDQFLRIFRIQMIQRCFKACGSFASFYNLRQDRRYLKYLTPTIHKVIHTLKDFNEYSEFLDILEKYELPKRDFKNL